MKVEVFLARKEFIMKPPMLPVAFAEWKIPEAAATKNATPLTDLL